MTRLTEEMVALRTRISTMGHVKKLNCWGTGISDISVVKQMTSIQVLALSLNNITSLESVVNLPYLETLYLRKNQIDDLDEVEHLKTLPALKFLWLDENPFCLKLGDRYRSTILRMLPNLERLDDKEITSYEREVALSEGVRELNLSEAIDDDTDTEIYDNQPEEQQQQQQPTSPRNFEEGHSYESASQSPTRHESSPTPQPPLQQQQQQQYRQPQQLPRESEQPRSPQYDSMAQQQQQQPQSHQRLSYHQPSDRSPEYDSPHVPSSHSTQSMKEYYQSDRPSYNQPHARSQTDLTDWHEPALHHRRSAGVGEILDQHGFRTNGSGLRENGFYEGVQRFHCSYHRRLLNRNSNLLSAALCLIKEMDIQSLEVMKHAVNSRLNEYTTE